MRKSQFYYKCLHVIFSRIRQQRLSGIKLFSKLMIKLAVKKAKVIISKFGNFILIRMFELKSRKDYDFVRLLC